MTHEPIRVIHFSPHVTWQGTQAELDAMLAEGWPMGSASEVIAACKRDVAEAEAYVAELKANRLANRVAIMRLEVKLAKALEALKKISSMSCMGTGIALGRMLKSDANAGDPWADELSARVDFAHTTIKELQGNKP